MDVLLSCISRKCFHIAVKPDLYRTEAPSMAIPHTRQKQPHTCQKQPHFTVVFSHDCSSQQS
uniref:Uncharacterized protein n=1 Tax=Arion vulgaris TaxID=1028688 RepID=A0A0B6Z903_9EUPU